ncbi:MAG: hypothetical protein ACTSW1_03165 [Candidatus Hodarchaeales archaeon]
MKLTEKSIDSCTKIRLKSGECIEIHLITNDSGTKSLVLEKDDSALVLERQEVEDFVKLFSEFLEDI